MSIAELSRQTLAQIARTHIRLLLLVAVGMLLLSATAIYFVERPSNEEFRGFEDCLWWAIVTMSTVGYGDTVPITTGGRVIALFDMVGGPVLLVTLVSASGISLYHQWRKGMEGQAQIASKGHIIVCGWNTKAKDIIAELRMSSQFHKSHITIIDDQISMNPVDDAGVSFVCGNPCEVDVLEQANIRHAKYAIVIASDATPTADQKTVLTILAIKSLNPTILSCAELNDAHNEGHIQRAKCDVVVNTNALTSKLLAMSVENPTVNAVVGELVTRSRGNEIYRIELPPAYKGHTFSKPFQELKSQHNVTVIGLDRDCQSLINPPPDLPLQTGDFLLVISEETPSGVEREI